MRAAGLFGNGGAWAGGGLVQAPHLEQAYLEYLAALPEEQAPSPEDQAQAQQALLEVDALLHALPTKVRQAFLLAQLEELPYAEIARRLGISHRTVSNYLTRAMEHCCLAMV